MNNENSQSRPRMYVPGPETETLSFGTWLRRQRELREISLREIADVTKISIRYLEALEHDRFDVLPAPVFAKGFLREYARYVGLDPDEVVNSYLTAQSSAEPEEEPEVRRSQKRGSRLEKSSGLMLALAVVALLALVAGLAYFLRRSDQQSVPEPPPIAAPPVAAETTSPAPMEETVVPTPAAPLVVTLDFSGECWVEAVIDDQQQLSELHVAGEAIRLEALERVVLTLGNPEMVLVEANGEPFTISAPPGEVARDVVIDLATLAPPDQQVP